MIPTYESADIVGRAIDSALAQTYRDLEVIVVDDGSTDDTASVVRSYEDDRVTYVEHAENRGGSAARNTGIDRADGEFVAFLDADDEWKPSKLERQVALLRDRSEEWVAAYCDYEGVPEAAWARVHNALGRVLGSSVERREGGDELVDEVLLGNFALGGSSTLLVRADAVEAIGGFDEAFPRHQDWEFLIRLLDRGKLGFVDETLVVKHQGYNAAADDVRAAKELFFETFEAEIDALEQQGHDVTGRHLFDLSRTYFQQGQFREGFHYLRRSNPYRNLRLTTLAFSLGMGVSSVVGRARLGHRGAPESAP